MRGPPNLKGLDHLATVRHRLGLRPDHGAPGGRTGPMLDWRAMVFLSPRLFGLSLCFCRRHRVTKSGEIFTYCAGSGMEDKE